MLAWQVAGREFVVVEHACVVENERLACRAARVVCSKSVVDVQAVAALPGGGGGGKESGWGVEFCLPEAEPGAGEAAGGLVPLRIVWHGSCDVAESVLEFVVKAGKGVGLKVRGGGAHAVHHFAHSGAGAQESQGDLGVLELLEFCEELVDFPIPKLWVSSVQCCQ